MEVCQDDRRRTFCGYYSTQAALLTLPVWAMGMTTARRYGRLGEHLPPNLLRNRRASKSSCYHAAMRWQRQEKQRPGRTDLALGREEIAHGAKYVDRNAVLRIGAALFESVPKPSVLVKNVAASFLARYFYQPTGSESEEYHKWYYNTAVWKKTTWMGATCWKWIGDMWNYQEILFDLKPSLVIEFGTAYGGSTLFFASVMRQIGEPFKVLSVDIYHGPLDPAARCDSDVLFVESGSTVPAIAEHIQRLKSEFPGKIFAILDSDHSMNHVLAEMKLFAASTLSWRLPRCGGLKHQRTPRPSWMGTGPARSHRGIRA